MFNPFKRNTVQQHRPALRPSPGMQAWEIEPALEVTEGNEDTDWAMWEDSVQQLDSGFAAVDPFGKVGRRDR